MPPTRPAAPSWRTPATAVTGIENYKNAFPVYPVPKLGGQHAAYMVVALKEYQDGNRAHATMHAQAVTLKPQDLADIAAYLAGAELKSPGRPVGTLPKAGQTCVACHGNDGVGIMPEYPNLAGQHEDYLATSLRGYKTGAAQEPDHGRHGGAAHRAGHPRAGEVLLVRSGPRSARPTTSASEGKCKGL